MWPLGRENEQDAVNAEAEAVARALAEPVIISQVLQTRSRPEAADNQLDIAQKLADEALHWARIAGDDWSTAMALHARAMAADSATELRERVDEAASLLEDVGNTYGLADLLTSAAYAALCHGSEPDASEFAARAIPITHKLDNPLMWMLLHGNVALAALLTGDDDIAEEAFREELKLCRELAVLPIAAEGLGGLAAVATDRDDLDRAARLYGAAGTHRYSQTDDPIDERLRTTFFEPARQRHGADAWDAVARAGAVLTFEDAIAYALKESPAPVDATEQH